jgi:hypothetical protein
MRMEISSVSARPLMEGENPRTIAATSLSDIVYGFHVAGCCIETRSDPTAPLVWRKLEVSPKLLALRRQKPQSPSCRCVWRSAFLILIRLCGIPGPHNGDCTYWPRSLHSSRSKTLDGAHVWLSRGQSPLPIEVFALLWELSDALS